MDDKCKVAQRPACRTCIGNGGLPHATTVHPTVWHYLEFGQVEALSEACSLPAPLQTELWSLQRGGPRSGCEADVDVS